MQTKASILINPALLSTIWPIISLSRNINPSITKYNVCFSLRTMDYGESTNLSTEGISINTENGEQSYQKINLKDMK